MREVTWADDINNNEGMGRGRRRRYAWRSSACLPVLSRARTAIRTPITPMPMMTRKRTTTVSSEESFGEVDRGTSAGEDINGGQLQISEFGREMKQSFIEYSMSSHHGARPCRTCATA